MFFTSFFSPLTWMLLFLCSSARWLLDLLRILQQPLGCLYGAQQANEGREVPTFFRGLSPPSANDRHRYRRLLAHPCSEDLQISASVGWASQIHRTGAQVLHTLASVTFNLLNVLVLMQLMWNHRCVESKHFGPGALFSHWKRLNYARTRG